MGKRMCKDKKEINKKEKGKSLFECAKCGEKATKEKHLCKPQKP